MVQVNFLFADLNINNNKKVDTIDSLLFEMCFSMQVLGLRLVFCLFFFVRIPLILICFWKHKKKDKMFFEIYHQNSKQKFWSSSSLSIVSPIHVSQTAVKHNIVFSPKWTCM